MTVSIRVRFDTSIGINIHTTVNIRVTFMNNYVIASVTSCVNIYVSISGHAIIDIAAFLP